AANEWNHAEVARKAAAVLDLDEGTHAIEPSVGLDAAEGSDVTGHECRRLLASAGDHGDVGGQAGEGVAAEIRGAAGHVDAAMSPGCARGGLPRLPYGFVRDAAGVDDGYVGAEVLRPPL